MSNTTVSISNQTVVTNEAKVVKRLKGMGSMILQM